MCGARMDSTAEEELTLQVIAFKLNLNPKP
jgi:hypothetical protein